MKTVFKSFILIATCLFYFESFSQDVITKRDGTDIQTKILEVTPNEIKYKKFDNQSGPTFTILISDVLMVQYENGTRDVFDQKKSNASGSDNLYELVEKGRQDAMMNYKGQNSGRGGVAATAILFGPVIGLIPAAIISSSEPDEGNLNTPNFELMKDPNYRKGYTDQAAKTKKKKVWKSYGIASGIWLGLIVATYAAY
ncbi:MAG TPA: hypothetical protein DCY95_21440 [Algoriphagus sp.]|jgi:hypothetical protein|uniref:hypothetical protein n=1 Tax=unclassified Algoriphagus TaxID=2641541 RepID=UPI000C4EDB0C|nr:MULTISPECIES: hypothetical protein [unclassified Algoriphagus]MAL14350.1 hypothetical protein [Algoriphagus sp.]HAD50525.1 hypothetical protein [Algoriphagus sp.]HAS59548.1 hypothetical protein [Algoriphagus sp.]HAZ26811.1 hypothetical protein [Algoriphagus sp.]HCH45244.1 hypothetical protein [Algoriphagus sp.]|tara:strand:- start:2707 stop:3300 length:594 start_codon:yes stop_codon:yes gene_type:complete